MHTFQLMAQVTTLLLLFRSELVEFLYFYICILVFLHFVFLHTFQLTAQLTTLSLFLRAR